MIGSTDMFADEYFEKEENSKFFDFLMRFFFTKEVEFDKKKEPTANADNEYNFAPDIAELSEKLKSCL